MEDVGAFKSRFVGNAPGNFFTLILSTLASSFSCSTIRRMLDKLVLEVMLMDESLVAERSWTKKSAFKEQQSSNEQPETRLWGETVFTSPQSSLQRKRGKEVTTFWSHFVGAVLLLNHNLTGVE